MVPFTMTPCGLRLSLTATLAVLLWLGLARFEAVPEAQGARSGLPLLSPLLRMKKE